MGHCGMSYPLRGVMIGSGAVASAMAPAMERGGLVVWEQVYSPAESHARCLADKLGRACAVSDVSLVSRDVALYLVSVKDDALPQVAAHFSGSDALWLHTSGSVPASVLSRVSSRYGVLYPLQTFSMGVEVDMFRVPLFVEGNAPDVESDIAALARSVSGSVTHADGKLRRRLHCAAVFACNFANHLWAVADKILREQPGLDITCLEPLLKETLRKAMVLPPVLAQTGPARRGDRAVMDGHKDMLSPADAELYEYLSNRIMKEYELDKL